MYFEHSTNKLLKEYNSKKNYKSLIKQDQDKEQKKVPEVKKPEQKKQETNTNIDSKEQEFLQKFIKYSELIYLNDSTDKIIQDFKRVLGPDNQESAVNVINKNKAEREQQIAELSKELNGLRESIQNEAKKAEAKVSLLSLLGKEQTNKEQLPKSPIKEIQQF